MNLSHAAAHLQGLWKSVFPAQAPVVSLAEIEDLNKFLTQAAAGHFGNSVAEAVQRMREGLQGVIAKEAPGSVAAALPLLEAILLMAKYDPAFLAAHNATALRKALADLESRVGAIRAALQ